MRITDSHSKSLLKAINWRIIATAVTMIISYFITGNVKYAATIGIIEAITKIFLYYLHERFWQLIGNVSRQRISN